MLTPLRRELARAGLHVAMPVAAERLSALGVCLESLLPGARAAVVVGDGGPTFFSRLGPISEDLGRDPLDCFTVREVERAATSAWGDPGAGGAPHRWAAHYPFRQPWLPFQRIGIAAGLPPPGPLALQIHPIFGPWWAYRALLLTTASPSELGDDAPAPFDDPCAGCPAPCVSVCPAGAVGRPLLDIGRCLAARLEAGAPCASACAARAACVVGRAHRYPAPQEAHHMGASLAFPRRR
jgi:ferredoxin